MPAVPNPPPVNTEANASDRFFPTTQIDPATM
jgi:hypothetical protein